MKWSEVPPKAKHYILYHTLTCPLLFTWYILPYYLLITGYTVIEVGFLFTAVEVLGTIATALIGRFFTKVDIRKGLIIMEFLGGLATFIYGFAKGYLAPLVILVGTLIEEVASIFYPLYQAYERLIYPRENLRDLLAWHLRLPELAIVLTYPIFGYIFGVLCPIPEFIRQSFFVFGLVWMTMVLYIAKFFPGIIPEKEVEHLTSTGDTFKWLKLYVIAHVIFMLAWSLAPTLSLVYYIIKVYNGNLLHVALVETAISSATILATYIVEKIPRESGYKALQAGTLLTLIGVVMIVLTPPFPLLLLAFYIVRLGDAIIFVFKRMWLFEVISAKQATLVPAYISSIVNVMSLMSNFISSILSYIDPRAPYVATLSLFTILVALYQKLKEYFRG